MINLMDAIRGRLGGCALLISAMLLLPACANVNLGEANKLAVAGHKTSTALEEEAAYAASDFALNDQRIWIANSLERKFAETPETKKLAELLAEERRKVLGLLKLRTQMLASLKQAYKAFGELVNYGAYAQTRDATVEFVGSTNQLITYINTNWKGSNLPLVSEQAGALAATGLGVVAEESRRRDITRINLILLEALKKVKLALERESEIAIALRQDTAAKKARLRTALLRRGLADYSPVVQQFAGLAGTTAASDSNNVVRRDPRTQTVIAEYLDAQEEAEQKRIAASYAAALATLDELIAQHEKLEKEKRVDIEQLLTYAKDFSEAYGAGAK